MLITYKLQHHPMICSFISLTNTIKDYAVGSVINIILTISLWYKLVVTQYIFITIMDLLDYNTQHILASHPAFYHMGRVKRIWYLSPMRAAKVQASLRIRAVSPEPPLLAHTSSESRGTFRQKARSLASLNGWACAVKICHDGMLEDTNSLDAAHMFKARLC